MVAQKGDILIAIEMKVCLTKKVIRQAYFATLETPWCYAAIRSNPTKKGIEKAKNIGIGIIKVTDKVEIILDPNPISKSWRNGNKIKSILSQIEPGGIGGMPCIRGVGPAQSVFDEVQKYKETRPKATWRELYKNIPNHYCSSSSMYNAMRTVEYNRLSRKEVFCSKSVVKRL